MGRPAGSKNKPKAPVKVAKKPVAKKTGTVKTASGAVKKVVKVGNKVVGVTVKKARVKPAEKAANKKTYNKTKAHVKAVKKAATKKETPKQKLAKGQTAAIRRALKEGKPAAQASREYTKKFNEGKVNVKGSKKPAAKKAATSGRGRGRPVNPMRSKRAEIAKHFQEVIRALRAKGKAAYAKAKSADAKKNIHSKTMERIDGVRAKRNTLLVKYGAKKENLSGNSGRKQGRPAGSTNKPKVAAKPAKKVAAKPAAKKMGRPAGSTNKPKVAAKPAAKKVAAKPAAKKVAAKPAAKKMGRPAGSKNKPKVAVPAAKKAAAKPAKKAVAKKPAAKTASAPARRTTSNRI